MQAAFADALMQMAKPIVERSERFLSMIVSQIVLNGGAFAPPPAHRSRRIADDTAAEDRCTAEFSARPLRRRRNGDPGEGAASGSDHKRKRSERAHPSPPPPPPHRPPAPPPSYPS